MDILGIGFPELLFIFIIALMIFGPRRLPEIAAKAGRIVRDLRNMSQGFMTEWQREIAAATHLEELEQVRKELEATKQSLRQTQQDLTSGVADIGKTIATAAALPNVTPPTSPTSLPTESNEISTATKEDSLSIVSDSASSPISSGEGTE